MKCDAVGNVIREFDGRFIETEYVVNQLNQVVQVVRAAEHRYPRAMRSEGFNFA